MQMYKIGLDIEKIERFDILLNKRSFVEGVYTQGEREHIFATKYKSRVAAGIYCAKEAASKAIGVGFFGIKPIDIEIFHNDKGAPQVRLWGNALKKYSENVFEVSISYTDEIASAVVIMY